MNRRNKITIESINFKKPSDSKLEALYFDGYIEEGKAKVKKHLVMCNCACGNKFRCRAYTIINGVNKSCGCAKKGVNKTHGLSKGCPLYTVWYNIKRRCYDCKNSQYKYYGGKGIIMCQSWKNDFQIFYDWAIKNGWERGLEIDRINSNKGYNPSNCRCVTDLINQRNKPNIKFIYFEGQKRTLGEWADLLNIPYHRLLYRYNSGWSKDKILNTKDFRGKGKSPMYNSFH